jgi:peroxiredoxin
MRTDFAQVLPGTVQEVLMKNSMTACATVGLVAAILGGPAHSLAEAAKFNREVDIGDKAPQWKNLEGTDGKRHSLAGLKKAKAVIVVFTCNHCPVAKAYEERLIKLARDFQKRDVVTVAISVSLVGADSLDAMKKRAAEKKYPFAYLHDPDQKTGHSYGSYCTPSVFLLDGDRRIAYMGKIDDSMYADRVEERFLRDAITALLSGRKPEITETKPFGCPIEYDEP